MERSWFRNEQVIAILKEQEAGMAAADACRRLGMSRGHLSQAEGQVWRA